MRACGSEEVVGNKIGVEGARALAEALKTNASVASIDLQCECFR